MFMLFQSIWAEILARFVPHSSSSLGVFSELPVFASGEEAPVPLLEISNARCSGTLLNCIYLSAIVEKKQNPIYLCLKEQTDSCDHDCPGETGKLSPIR